MTRSINRRRFLRSGGLLACGVAAMAGDCRLALAAVDRAEPVRLSDSFPLYTAFNPLVPVHCATPKLSGCFHRFFNTSPISPSGRYLAVTRLLHEDRLSLLGEEAEIVLVDLVTGQPRVLTKAKGFDSQVGAQAQWGATDNELYFNDLDTKQWRAFGVRLDPLSGERHDLGGPIFEVSRDGRYAASICLLRSAITQRGYGVVVPTELLPRNEGAASDGGVYLTDTATGACRLLVSYKDIVDACGESLRPSQTDRGGGYHGHQLSWNPQGTRLWLALAFNYSRPMTSNLGGKLGTHRCEMGLVTLKPDGTDIRVALPFPMWQRQGGNHPCWCQDGEHISMNFRMDGNKHFSLVRMCYDGQDLTPLTPVVGSGHPTLHPDGRHILTDTYQGELPGFRDGTVPIRWIDTAAGADRTLVRIQSRPPYSGPFEALRVDPHPAWDRTFRRVAFNACPTGTRRVYIADIPQNLL
jgi:hypothetical protein